MGKSAMVPVEEVDLSNVQYRQEKIDAPHLTGNFLKLCVWIVESRLLGRSVLSFLKSKNKVTQILQHTRIPEAPMFFPEFPPQDPQNAVNCVDEYTLPTLRVASALECLPAYNSSTHWGSDSRKSFLYWTIRDYAHAYRCGWTTPSDVAEYIISAVEKSLNDKPAMMFFISFNADEVRKQAAASTTRFQEGKPLSILDGIFIPIKDDIDCYPYPTRGGTVWFHKMREVKKDAVSVSRLRSCGVILVGKANMHELGMGVTGNNPHHGALCEGGTVESVTPLAATVEDAMLVYAAMSGSSPTDLTRLRPMPPCYPKLGTTDNLNVLGSIKLGKYANWFNDVYSDEISETCERMLSLLTRSFGIETREIVLPELEEMRVAHIVSIGSEALSHVYSSFNQGRRMEMSYDVRVNMALFESFSAANYVSAQSLRRRIMHYHMEAFKLVDIIVTPTTGMTAPKIPPSSLKIGETDLQTSGYLMRFVIAPNLIGLPAISVPVGYDKDGLPIGLQLIGQPWAEATLLRLASAIEELAPSQKRPAVFYDVLEGKSKF